MASSIFNQKRHRQKIEFRSASFFRLGDEFKIIDGEIVYYKLPDYVNCNNAVVTLIVAKTRK